MCQDMPTGLYTRWDYKEETQGNTMKARQNRVVQTFENMVMPYLQASRTECKIESYFTTGTQKKIDCFSVDGYCNHCKTVFEAMGCYFNFCPCQEARPFLTDDDINRGTKKREMDGLRKDYIREKGYFKEEMWDCSWWEKIRNETMFGSVQCDLFPMKRAV